MKQNYQLQSKGLVLSLTLLFYLTWTTTYSQNTFSINKTITVLHVIEDDSRFTTDYKKLIDDINNDLPEEYFQNSIKNHVFVNPKNPGKNQEYIEAFINDNKIANQILDFLLSENDGELNIDLINQRMNEVASDNTFLIDGLTTTDTETSVQRAYFNRVLNTNYLLVLHHHNTVRIDDINDAKDSVYAEQYARELEAMPAKREQYQKKLAEYEKMRKEVLKEAKEKNILESIALQKLPPRPTPPPQPVLQKVVRTERGYTMRRDKYLFKLNLGDSIINNYFWENGWADNNSTAEKKKKASDVRNNLHIPIDLVNAVNNNVKSIIEFDENGKVKTGLASLTSALQRFNNGDNPAEYNDEAMFKGLIAKNMTPSALKNVSRGKRDLMTSSAIFNTQPIEVKIGRKQGLKVNHRYDVLRRTLDQNTGQVKRKRIGSILATTYISSGSRGEDGKRRPSKFIQLEGKKLDLGDQVVENRIPAMVYGGFSSDGLVLRVDGYIPPIFPKLKYGQKVYLDIFYDPSDKPDIPNEINVGGESLKTRVSVFSAGLGLSKEWYFLKRFIAGPLIGFRYYRARFNNEKVEESLVPESQRDNYGVDLALEVGARFGMRLTHDLSLTATASYNTVNFNDPFVDGDGTPVFESDGGRFPLEGYSSHFEIAIRYDFQSFNYKK